MTRPWLDGVAVLEDNALFDAIYPDFEAENQRLNKRIVEAIEAKTAEPAPSAFPALSFVNRLFRKHR